MTLDLDGLRPIPPEDACEIIRYETIKAARLARVHIQRARRLMLEMAGLLAEDRGRGEEG